MITFNAKITRTSRKGSQTYYYDNNMNTGNIKNTV